MIPNVTNLLNGRGETTERLERNLIGNAGARALILDKISRANINFLSEKLRAEVEDGRFTITCGFGEAFVENEISLFPTNCYWNSTKVSEG
ncbi:hypothetical protein NPIL_176491 [Nephila pilipes]|uniref:Uncharacterized protein n=1 Tax=Nephila pilipes TaxID=299642 RepID=A0A8X6U3V3_NEPPI|nr:hypothetical protein NPIL_176491 [Nephila pilipes]